MKKISVLFIALFFIATFVYARQDNSLPDSNLTPANSVYWGVFINAVPSTGLSALSSFEKMVNKHVSMVLWYQGWGNTGGTQYLEPAWMDKVRAHGSIPFITWAPWNSKQYKQYKQSWINNQPAYQLKNIYNGTYDAYIIKWAKDAKVWGHPFFLTFAPEMNGYWHPWSEQLNGNQPGDYVKAWRRVHDIFTANGATNVTWVWTINVEGKGETPIAELYPGSNYVDWIGIDGYNWGTSAKWRTWKTFSEIYTQTYNDVQRLAPGKPIAIKEFASTELGGDKAAWITDTFTKQLPNNFPNIKAFNWFNTNKETDWRVESSSSSLQAFVQAIASAYYASNEFSTFDNSPIPPP